MSENLNNFYEVFISAKSEDYPFALPVYNLLMDQGINTFLSIASLQRRGDSDYRKEIDLALEQAVHMVVVTSSAKNVNASWVEAEWGTFVNEKRSGRKSGNIVTVLADGLQPESLPVGLRYYEAINFDESDLKRILSYVRGNGGHPVDTSDGGFKPVDPDKSANSTRDSDFVIHSSKDTSKLKPLVLQNNFNKKLIYVDSYWDHSTTVPFWDEKPLRSRTLPGLDVIYPYLTVSDFLEEDIIRLVYPINAERYFDGNLKLNSPDETKSFLLPLKPYFFQYFNAWDLVSGEKGRPRITIEQGIPASVTVQLKIPVAGGKHYIVFERIYYNDGSTDQKSNKGAIKELQFGVTIFPFLRHNAGIDPYYYIQLVDRDLFGRFADCDYTLNFYSGDTNTIVPCQFERDRNKKQKGDLSRVGTKYFSLDKVFDYIQVDNKLTRGIIIPKLAWCHDSPDQFTFAVDFGTTHTHIEYSVNGRPSAAFEIHKEDAQAVPLFTDKTDHNFSGTGAIDIRAAIVREFVPEIIGNGSPYHFPQRSVISQSKNNAPANGGKALVDYNIPFDFEHHTDVNNQFFTNLQSDRSDQNNDFRVKAFLEELILLIRNKIIINSGNLADTKIIWTYPVNMTTAGKNNMQRIWNELFHKYITAYGEPIDMCEAIAPYYCFHARGSLRGSGFGPNVLMDIGGQISYAVVYEDSLPKMISSYKFAANTIFGDGYREFSGTNKNAIINKYKDFFDQNLFEKKHYPLKSISDEIYAEQKPADYIDFLFSLVNRTEIKEKDLFDYEKKIAADHHLKIIFLYFYCAKVYYIARLMNVNKIGLPMNFIFIGNGSKILNIISPNPKTISDLTKAIFLKVYRLTEYLPAGLQIKIERQFPEEVICKGALLNYIAGNPDVNVTNLKRILTCAEGEGKFSLLNSEINDALLNKVVAQVEEFNSLFIDLNNTIPFKEHFDVSPKSFETFELIVNKYIKAYTYAGIDFNQRLDWAKPQPSAHVSETLFFYPMVATIQDIIKELAPLDA